MEIEHDFPISFNGIIMLSSVGLPNCRCKSGWKARCIMAYIDLTFYVFFRFIQRKHIVYVYRHHGCNLSVVVGKHWQALASIGKH